jgi:two-component system, LytTR family, sensor kinase
MTRLSRILGYPRLLVLAAAWTLLGTLAFARQYLSEPAAVLDQRTLAAYFGALTCYLPWIALSAIVMDVERRFPLGRPPWSRNVAVLVVLSIPLVYLAWALTTVFALGVKTVFQSSLEIPSLTWIIPARELLGHQFLYWSAVGGSYLLRTLLEARENERRAGRLALEKSRLEASLRQSELDALRMRLHPHFLFNSLQNIAVLTQHDPLTASRMLTRLGDLLRVSLGTSHQVECTLDTEIALTRAYLAIEQMRFGDRLSAVIDVARGTERALVPTFLLQPLVENAIRHGLQNVRVGGVIAIASAVSNGSLVLTVTDNGIGPPAAPLSRLPLGVGLGATRERLARMYPARHTLSMIAVPEGGTEVRLTLPLTTAPAMEDSERAFVAAADRGR